MQKAQYADLAERFSVDKVYPGGTVMVIDRREDVTHELTACNEDADDSTIGVISDLPAFRMNAEYGEDSDNPELYPYVALKGRLEVLTVGKIKKGDLLITSAVPGHAQAATDDDKRKNPLSIFGKAYTSSKDGKVLALIT